MKHYSFLSLITIVYETGTESNKKSLNIYQSPTRLR